jgi:subtilisin family serine protease
LPTPQEGFDALIRKAETSGPVRVIARLPMPVGPAGDPVATVAQVQSDAAARMQAYGVTSQPLTARFPLMIAEVSAAQLTEMRAAALVESIIEDGLARPTLAQSGPLVRQPQALSLGATGAGQAVAILDTGVDAGHPFFGGRVTAEACFSTTSAAQGARTACPNGRGEQIGAGAARPCSAPGCDHGTHVAGIAAGSRQDFSGMAPQADIIAVQVFSIFEGAVCGGSGPCVASYTSDQIRGLDHVLSLASSRPVAAANMSLGGGSSTRPCDDDVTKLAIDALAAAGVATVIAAGNDGRTNAVSRPGCISTAVTVAATTKQDRVASFSNRSVVIDLFAPGADIISSVPGGGFRSFSGTSMAAPHVAGGLAALRALGAKPGAGETQSAIANKGRAISDAPSGLTRGRMDLEAAAQALQPKVAAAQVEIAPRMLTPDDARAALAQLPRNQPTRFIVQVYVPEGAMRAQAMDAAMIAARNAGCTKAETLSANLGLIVLEGPPPAIAVFAQSGHARGLQQDQLARPQ